MSGRLPPILLALAAGAAGGALFHWLRLPLAWMIGAMCFTTVAAAAGAPIGMSQRLRAFMIAVLGVMLGSAFTPALLEALRQWGGSLGALVLYVAAATALTQLYYRKAAGYDATTAYFAAAPGGLSEMTVVGTAFGGDERAISLSHGARVLLIVLAIPFGFQVFGGYRPAGGAATVAAAVDPLDLLILGGCGVVGFVLARRLRLPAAPLVGPMALSAVAHFAGLTASRPPAEIIAVAQVVIGAGVGCRFAGIAVTQILRALALAVGATAILLATTAGFAAALGGLGDLSAAAVLLAFAPGGLAEMSLIGLALGVDVAYVATHHVVRIFLIVALAPLVFRLLRRRA